MVGATMSKKKKRDAAYYREYREKKKAFPLNTEQKTAYYKEYLEKKKAFPLNTELNQKTSQTKEEMVNHPKHYQSGKFEVIDIIEDFNLGFNLGNSVKYILRSNKKHNELEDLKKAVWYLQREINLKSRL
jgi:hypothetical protein